jgi:hypothetical protein
MLLLGANVAEELMDARVLLGRALIDMVGVDVGM